MFVREDWTLFRNIETLTQKAGVPGYRLRTLVAKELTDNALDAAGGCKIGYLDGGGFFITDNGPGIASDPQDIARLFSINRPLMSSKLYRLPTRGMLGNGLRVVAGAVLASEGKLRVQTGNKIVTLFPQDSGETLYEVNSGNEVTGTRIEVWLGENIPTNGDSLFWANMACRMAGGTSYKGKPSPHWYDPASFFELFQAAKSKTVREVVEVLDGCSGSKAGKIARDYAGHLASSLAREDVETVLALARDMAIPVNPDRLGYVGAEVFPSYSYHKTAATAQFSSGVRIPFTAEVWAEENERIPRQYLTVCINRTPITASVSAWVVEKELIIHGCGLDVRIPKVGKSLFNLVLNLTTPYLGLTSDGKSPDLRPFAESIQGVFEKAVTRAKRATITSPKATSQDQKSVILANLQTATEKVSNNDRHRFSLRQLFYAVRPFLLEAFSDEPNYDYFSRVIGDYESAHGGIKGMYHDPRGTLYHPHLKESIPLGTLAVEEYQYREWTFNKILYIEKEGFFSILQSEEWPERHDCALLTSKGYASRAARDVIDLLGETDGDLLFFCVHDADAAGTMIHQTLQEATRARPKRKVEVINLGLDPWDAVEMGLQVERVKHQKRAPVAEYIPAEWANWLQTNRVELNAMTTAQFIGWLDSKMKSYGNGKLIPPTDVLFDRIKTEALELVSEDVRARILQDAGFPKQVQVEFSTLLPRLEATRSNLVALVREDLTARPETQWSTALENLAKTVRDSAS